MGLSVYEQEFEAYPGMVETLERLREEGHCLHLYTGAKPEYRSEKSNR